MQEVWQVDRGVGTEAKMGAEVNMNSAHPTEIPHKNHISTQAMSLVNSLDAVFRPKQYQL